MSWHKHALILNNVTTDVITNTTLLFKSKNLQSNLQFS